MIISEASLLKEQCSFTFDFSTALVILNFHPLKVGSQFERFLHNPNNDYIFRSIFVNLDHDVVSVIVNFHFFNVDSQLESFPFLYFQRNSTFSFEKQCSFTFDFDSILVLNFHL